MVRLRDARISVVVLFAIACFALYSGVGTTAAFGFETDVERLARIYGHGNLYDSISLSRDGRRIAFIEEREAGSRHVMVQSMEKNAPAQAIYANSDDFIDWVIWIGPGRLLVGFWSDTRAKLKGKAWPKARMLALDADGRDQVRLEIPLVRFLDVYSRSALVHSLPTDGDYILVTAPTSGSKANHVYKMNTRTAEMELVVTAPEEKVYTWHTDKDGVVRVGHGYNKKLDGHLVIRSGESDSWRTLSDSELFAEGRFFVHDFTDDPNILIVGSSFATGRIALHRFDLKRGRLTGTLFKHKTLDAIDVVYSEQLKKAVAALYYDNKLEIEFLDDNYRKQYEAMAALFDDDFIFTGLSEDESKALVLVSGSKTYGDLYFYDVTAGAAKKIFSLTPYAELDDRHPVEVINYLARDGVSISGYLTRPKGLEKAKQMPLILLPHGGPHARDAINYDDWSQHLAAMGYAVFQPNFRGSAGFGQRFQALGYGQWGKDMHRDLIDGLDALIRKDVVDPKRVCILGGSYGGYAAMWGIVDSADRFRCAVSFAGISDIKKLMKDEKFYDDDDFRYYRIVGGMKKGDIGKRSPIKFIKNVKGPILLGHGAKDDRVDVSQTVIFHKALKKKKKNVTTLLFEDDDHYLFRRKNREEWFAAVGKFLILHNPPSVGK